MLVIDNYIKDNTFLKDLKNDEFWNTMANANWWDGWWNKKSKNICEQFIEIVWKQFSNVENKVAGFEYWSNVHQTGGGLNWHVDKDERLSKEKKEVVTPTLGLVFYSMCEDLDGGYLEIANSRNRDNIDPNKIERIKPIENRLIMFDPSFPHRVNSISNGRRRAIIVNAWTKKPYTFANSDRYP